MKTSLFFSITIFVILCIASANSLLEETCRKVTKDVNGYNFCVTSLQVDPGSQKADTRGLATISTDLDKANFTQTLTKIKALLAGKSLSRGARMALNDCLDLYSSGLDYLKGAGDSIRSGDFFSANSLLSGVTESVETCKEGFIEEKVASLLTKENDNASNLSSIALAITALLL